MCFSFKLFEKYKANTLQAIVVNYFTASTCGLLFYDQEFVNKLDKNPYLLCFNNYVVDFKEKTWRNGQPDDYISKCTNIDYIPYNDIKDSK